MEQLKRVIDIKLLKFLIVGVINTLVGALVMFSLYNLLGLSYWISSASNYIVGCIVSFVLNKNFTFNVKGTSSSMIIKFIVSVSLCYVLAYGIAKPAVLFILANQSVKVQENIAMLVGMCLYTFLNYFAQRFFAFKE